MIKKIGFIKLVGAGNDFILIDNRIARIVSQKKLSGLARTMCDRIFGAGADGLLVLENSKKADVRMRIFNADGSEAEMCGNGARCFAYYVVSRKRSGNAACRQLSLETKAGIVKAEVRNDLVKVNLTPPHGTRLDLPLTISRRRIRVNFINTGVPHAVIFVQGLDDIDVAGLGRQVRYHGAFAPAGTNVNFVEVVSRDRIAIRTYERGVEGETLACGTGSTAAALIASMKLSGAGDRISVKTRGGEVLRVYFRKTASGFKDVWLEGKARIVYKGEYHV